MAIRRPRAAALTSDVASLNSQKIQLTSEVKILEEDKVANQKSIDDAISIAKQEVDNLKEARDSLKKEVDAEIKERKARISTMKDAIEVLQQGKASIAPSARTRSKESGG